MNALLPPASTTLHQPLTLPQQLVRFALVGPVPELGFLLQAVAIGTAVGAAVALRASRRDRHADTWAITTAWATLALLVGVLIELVSSWI